MTTSQDSFSGPIGKILNSLVSDWQMDKYNQILSSEFPQLPKEVIENLSRDQFYAYQICMAIILGRVDNDLALLKAGGLLHARWLTLACRILRFCISQATPRKNLLILAEF